MNVSEAMPEKSKAAECMIRHVMRTSFSQLIVAVACPVCCRRFCFLGILAKFLRAIVSLGILEKFLRAIGRLLYT